MATQSRCFASREQLAVNLARLKNVTTTFFNRQLASLHPLQR